MCLLADLHFCVQSPSQVLYEGYTEADWQSVLLQLPNEPG